MVVCYSKSEVDGKVNGINSNINSLSNRLTPLEAMGKWVYFQQKTVTMEDYNSAFSKDYIMNVFPANSIGIGEDMLIKIGGTITVQGSRNNPSGSTVSQFQLCFGFGTLVTAGGAMGRPFFRYQYLNQGNVSINQPLSFQSCALTWIALGKMGASSELNATPIFGGLWLAGNIGANNDWGTKEEVIENPTMLNLQFVNTGNMNVKPTAMNITFTMYKRPGILLNNNSVNLFP